MPTMRRDAVMMNMDTVIGRGKGMGAVRGVAFSLWETEGDVQSRKYSQGSRKVKTKVASNHIF